MEAKEKAIELVDKYYWTFGDGYLGDQHIQCALIAVDEILRTGNVIVSYNVTDYWQEVKKEIEKL